MCFFMITCFFACFASIHPGSIGSLRLLCVQAAVFKVVNAEDGVPSKPAGVRVSPQVLSTSEGALAADLIREYLEFHELQSTLAVLIPEANMEDNFSGRSSLANRMGLAGKGSRPLLAELISAYMSRENGTPAPTSTTTTTASNKPNEPSRTPATSLNTASPQHQTQASGTPASPSSDNDNDDAPHRNKDDTEKFGFGASRKDQKENSEMTHPAVFVCAHACMARSRLLALDAATMCCTLNFSYLYCQHSHTFMYVCICAW
jgi:hypothetical protein